MFVLTFLSERQNCVYIDFDKGNSLELFYRVTLVVADLSLVYYYFGHCTLCLVLIAQTGIWQSRLGNWASWWNIQINVNTTQVHDHQNHPVMSFILRQHELLSLTLQYRLVKQNIELGRARFLKI